MSSTEKPTPNGRALPTITAATHTNALFKNAKTGKPRACGSCMACCTAMIVTDLPERKPAGRICAHARQRRGCTIYAERPPSCRNYTCYWSDGLFEQRDRPDRIGLIADSSDGVLAGFAMLTGRPIMAIREVWPGAHRGKRFKFVMSGLRRRTNLIYHGKGYPYLMGPKQEATDKLNAASALLDHWGTLANLHRTGEHDTKVPDCPLCEGQCPVHSAETFQHPDCTICRDTAAEAADCNGGAHGPPALVETGPNAGCVACSLCGHLGVAVLTAGKEGPPEFIPNTEGES